MYVYENTKCVINFTQVEVKVESVEVKNNEPTI